MSCGCCIAQGRGVAALQYCCQCTAPVLLAAQRQAAVPPCAAVAGLQLCSLPAMARSELYLQTIASREISPIDSIVISVTVIKAGTAHNVIPDDVELIGTLRALTVSTFNYGVSRVEELAGAVGASFRCNVTVGWDSALSTAVRRLT